MNNYFKLNFFSPLFQPYYLSFVFLQAFERQRAQDAPVRNIFRSLLVSIVSKRRISLFIEIHMTLLIGLDSLSLRCRYFFSPFANFFLTDLAVSR